MTHTLQAINTDNNNILLYTQPSSKAAQTAPSVAPSIKTSSTSDTSNKLHVIHDRVTLSQTAQARQLLLQGRSVSQIAAALSTTPATVNSELGITPTTDTTVTPPTSTIAQNPATTHPISLPAGSSAGVSTQQLLSAVA